MECLQGSFGSQFSSEVAPHASPFWDIASQYVPRDIKTSLRWAEYLYSANPTYASATQRQARYLITDLDLSGQANTILLRYTLFFEKLQIRKQLAMLGISVLVYGNAFLSVMLPFDRFLRCPSCGMERLARKCSYEFNNYQYHMKCPCGYNGEHKRRDKFSFDVTKAYIKQWDPKLMEIDASVTGEKEYYLHIPPMLRYKVMSNHKFTLDTTPWGFIESVKEDKMFKFGADNLLHVSSETLPGFNLEWGLPPCISLFKLHYQSAVLRKANEAIATSFIVPLRVLFPTSSSAASDPMMVTGLSHFKSRLETMIKKHRMDPTYTQVSPVPIGVQTIGGEGKALSTAAELEMMNKELLNGCGYPAELYYGTLTVQALPAALRLFENSVDFLYYGYNEVLQFVANKIGRHFGWDPIVAKLQRITLADDIERRQVLMQLAASQQGSREEFFKAYGMDWERTTEKTFREGLIEQEIQKRVAEEFKMQQQVDSQEAPTTPQDRKAMAQQLAMQVVSDPANSRQLLNQLAQSDEQLHALVKEYAERIRSQQSSQAGQAALQQGLVAAGYGGVTGAGTVPM